MKRNVRTYQVMRPLVSGGQAEEPAAERRVGITAQSPKQCSSPGCCSADKFDRAADREELRRELRDVEDELGSVQDEQGEFAELEEAWPWFKS